MRDALAGLPAPQRLLTALLLLLGALVAPHVVNLSPLILTFFYSALLWRLVAQRRPEIMPGRWLLLVLMVGALALVVFTTNVTDGRLGGTALLTVMLGLKLLELRERRDIHVTVFLGFFLVLTQFLYDQSMWLAAYLFVGVMALVSIQVGLNRVNIEPRLQIRNTLVMIAGALPLALVVFLLFPRLQSPLWGISTASATTGIGGDMSLGDIGAVSRSSEVAFRVRFSDRIPLPDQRYWRGPVLWHTDGRRWSAGEALRSSVQPLSDNDTGIGYEITLEPTGADWLFGLDLVTEIPPDSQLDSNFSLVSKQSVNQRLVYRLRSDPDYRLLRISAAERRQALQLPPRISPRVRQLVTRWLSETDPTQPLQLVQRALDHYRNQPFVYTLSPGKLEGDPIDRFLFETRRGFCEHYAGSFALLMRLAGVPTRVVVGYQGGEKNPHADHWLVRQSDAHAWTEVWLPHVGWWRVDPTAAVAPERVEQSIDAALSRDSDRVVFQLDNDSLASALLRNAAWFADAVDFGWHHWVVGFTAERQKTLLESFGLRDLKGLGLGITLIIGSALAITLVYLIAQIPRAQTQDPLPALWQRLLHKLQRSGVQAPPWHGPDTVCRTAIEAFPDAAEQLLAINRMYVQMRYGRNQDQQQIKALRKRVDHLKLSR